MNEQQIRDLLEDFRKGFVAADEIVGRFLKYEADLRDAIEQLDYAKECSTVGTMRTHVIDALLTIGKLIGQPISLATPPGALSQRATSKYPAPPENKYADPPEKQRAQHEAFHAMQQACTCSANPDYCKVHAA